MKKGDKVILKRRPGYDNWYRGAPSYFYDGMEGEFVRIELDGDYICNIIDPYNEIREKYFAEEEVHPIKIENSISSKPKTKTKINFNY
jgi:DNA-binding protein